ncbi:MAG: DUF2382 domain-containing protein [Gaiellaceae bacterium]
MSAPGSGGGNRRPRAAGDPSLVRHEETLHAVPETSVYRHVAARRETTSRRVSESHPRLVENLRQERVPAAEGDSGEIEMLPDGSMSIPLFEEELVVTRRQVLRERVIIRKEEVTEWQTVEADLRREHVSFEEGDTA